jgi:hypothetical protein
LEIIFILVRALALACRGVVFGHVNFAKSAHPVCGGMAAAPVC